MGTYTCAEYGESDELSCEADDVQDLSRYATWEPDDTILEMAKGPGDYTYVLTDYYLYTFDTWNIGDELEPIGRVSLKGENQDYGVSMVVYGNLILVGGMTGVHVFDISSPEAPVQVNYLGVGEWVNDIVVHNSVAYFAAKESFSVRLSTPRERSASRTCWRYPKK